jgi:hypothetical protein
MHLGKKGLLLLLSMLVLFIGSLARIDRIFFKRNHSFCIRFIYSSIDENPEWNLPVLTKEEENNLDEILNQKFYYLAKGAHCYAFISKDQKYVIKFHRYASHMRIFPWLNHPFSYRFSKDRQAIMKHNLEKLSENMLSYKNSVQFLKEETGLIMVHLNRSNSLRRYVTIVDTTHAEYRVPLDQVTFILQHKADLIYPTLDRLVLEKKIDEAKKIVTHVIDLIANCCKKGYIDEDPVLRKNYGLIAGRAIHIDVGDLVKNEKIQLRENYIPHVREMTESLRARLEKQYPELLDHYYKEIERL